MVHDLNFSKTFYQTKAKHRIEIISNKELILKAVRYADIIINFHEFLSKITILSQVPLRINQGKYSNNQC